VVLADDAQLARAQQVGAWCGVLPGLQASDATAVAHEVASRLRQRESVEEAARLAVEQSDIPGATRWRAMELAQGWAGVAVACGYLDRCFPDEAWDRVGHEYLTLAVHGVEAAEALPIGLWSGLSGVAFAAWYLSRSGTRYRTLCRALDEALQAPTSARAADLADQNAGVAVGEYDLISGLAGVGAYLLVRRDDRSLEQVSRAVVTSLIHLLGDDTHLPRWRTPADRLVPYMQAEYPRGNMNCGLAHGLPGPLAVLALALRAGLEVDGLAAAIDHAAGWLVAQQIFDAWGPTWPSAVPLDPDQPASAPSRNGWCYGSPGVARALWLAGDALGRRSYCNVAVEAMAAIYRRPAAARRLASPTFCHGLAGLLQTTLRFAHDTGLPLFAHAAQVLTTELLAAYEPASVLGYRSVERLGRRADRPGLLDGAAGVPLVLLAAALGVEPTWDRLVLLS
jgi:lantibiotic biosynthesis protein